MPTCPIEIHNLSRADYPEIVVSKHELQLSVENNDVVCGTRVMSVLGKTLSRTLKRVQDSIHPS